MNVKETFLALTRQTYPYGYEDILEPFLPAGAKKDEHGNYHYTIGHSKTAFTCHLDTASKAHVEVRHVEDLNYIRTDGTSILGADDKAGMVVLLYLIGMGVPGTYFFFVGEECGCVGSRAAAKDRHRFAHFDRMISFDRRGTTSVITHQSSQRTCSEKFASALSSALNKHGLAFRPDDTGVYTDSAEFSGIIPECTNISVGYNKEHTHQESQNIEFLERLCAACARIDFDSLPTSRDPKVVEYKSYNYGSARSACDAGQYYYDANWPRNGRRNKKGRRGGTLYYPGYPSREDEVVYGHDFSTEPDYYWVDGQKVFYNKKGNKKPAPPHVPPAATPESRRSVDKYTALRDMYLNGEIKYFDYIDQEKYLIKQ